MHAGRGQEGTRMDDGCNILEKQRLGDSMLVDYYFYHFGYVGC